MTTTQNETVTSLLGLVGLEPSGEHPVLEAVAQTDHRYLRDLKINVGNVLNSSQTLTKKESRLLALSIAVNEKYQPLIDSLTAAAKQEGASDNEISETIACTSLLSTNNVFYRFRHFVGKDYYQQTQPGIRMSIMMNPVLGKEFFELMSLAVSAVNGCELCVKSHEESVLKHGATEARVFDAVRLAAVIKGLITTL
ncbi:carboxymuconolactone decarboxylase family protein [Spirosoma oryzicola]|uniref:carboxymuconolactone decarboxylase family protein n=1 Tax=Spirosoma oryzicola TaxID=2898794 RepID=UPI001E34C3C8|nr:carboxymuconolactone decarboxylase family protein [Spirosoma oryzicola]UHG89450.1 carboxymuconolactone decarboxylase family protein [Spirosoma oryzicola]